MSQPSCREMNGLTSQTNKVPHVKKPVCQDDLEFKKNNIKYVAKAP